MSEDPSVKTLREENIDALPNPEKVLHDKNIVAFFSPRKSLDALEWCADRIECAKSSVSFTAAFGVNQLFADKLSVESDALRYVLLEKRGKNFNKFSQVKNNKVALGSVLSKDISEAIGDSHLHKWLGEKSTNLNVHVRYLHTKYTLVDPLSDNPLVISGSANFSKASIKNNDENMLAIFDNKRVADIFISEFMRLFNHFYFRYVVSMTIDKKAKKSPYLKSNDRWVKKYFRRDSVHKAERELFR